MTKLRAAFPDAESRTVDLLDALIADVEPGVTVGVGVPDGWTPTESAHLSVAWDGTPIVQHPIVAHTTIRVTAYADSPTEAKRLAALAQGLLCAHAGGDGIAAVTALTGVLPARDPQTRAEIASVTNRVTVRSEPIDVGS